LNAFKRVLREGNSKRSAAGESPCYCEKNGIKREERQQPVHILIFDFLFTGPFGIGRRIKQIKDFQG
jgi:hypothetical protein